MRKALFLILLVPVIELWCLIEVGSEIGGLSTILLCFFTAALGIHLIRIQGLNLVNDIQEKLASGIVPDVEAVNGIAIAIGGACLLLPGFITDTIGLLLLLPISRTWFTGRLVNMLGKRVYRPESDIIEGEFTRGSDDDRHIR